MNTGAIQLWLTRKKARGILSHYALAVGALVAAALVLFLTFWFTYAVIWIGWRGVVAITDLAFSSRPRLTHQWRLVASGIFLLLLFVQHYRTRPEYWGSYPRERYLLAPGFQYHAGLAGSLGFMLAYPGASANMIADILLSGPRLVSGAWHAFTLARSLKHLAPEACAPLLDFLARRPSAVPYEELRQAGWEPYFAQLHSLEGIVFLKTGITLSQELRQELGRQ